MSIETILILPKKNLLNIRRVQFEVFKHEYDRHFKLKIRKKGCYKRNNLYFYTNFSSKVMPDHKIPSAKKTGVSGNYPETRAFVRVAHKISSDRSKPQVIKIDGKYYRVKELG